MQTQRRIPIIQDSIISLHLMTLSKNNIEELPKKVFYHILSSTFDWEKKSSASSSCFIKNLQRKKNNTVIDYVVVPFLNAATRRFHLH